MNFLDYDTVFDRLDYPSAVAALRGALQEGFDPAEDLARQAIDVPGGEFLLMPSATPAGFGIKLLSVNAEARGNDPRIQGTYVLFDQQTFAPKATIDGIALTNLRTPAVSLAGIADVLDPESTGPLSVAIFGTGPQARAHAAAVREVYSKREVEVTFLSRSQPEDLEPWAPAGTEHADKVLRGAELIITTTTAAQPVLDDTAVRDDAVVVAVGSHSPSARELPGALLGRSQVIIEDPETCFREAGDVIQAMDEGALERERLVTFRDVVRGEVRLDRTRPVVFKFTGMPWEDLVLAEAVASAR